MNIPKAFSFFLGLFNVQDYLELIIIVGMVYTFLYIIKKHYASIPLWHIYIPINITIFAYYTGLETITFGGILLLISFMIAISIYVTIFYTYTPKMHHKNPVTHFDWVTTLIQSMLHIPAKHLPFATIIEQSRPIDHYFKSECRISGNINPLMLDILFTYEKNMPGQAMVITNHGTFKEACATYDDTSKSTNDYEALIQKNILLTHATDAIALIRLPHAHTFTLVYQGSYTEALSAAQTIRLLRKICFNTVKEEIKTYHGTQKIQKHIEQ